MTTNINNMNHTWYPCVEEGNVWQHHMVSDLGYVKVLERDITHYCRAPKAPVGTKQKITRHYKEKILKFLYNPHTGYYSVRLSHDGVWIDRYVSRLVVEAVTGKRIPPGIQIDHKNDDKSDNSFDNLQPLENGPNVWKGKGTILTKEIMIDVLARYDAGEVLIDMALIHGARPGTIAGWLQGYGLLASLLLKELGREPIKHRPMLRYTRYSDLDVRNAIVLLRAGMRHKAIDKKLCLRDGATKMFIRAKTVQFKRVIAALDAEGDD